MVPFLKRRPPHLSPLLPGICDRRNVFRRIRGGNKKRIILERFVGLGYDCRISYPEIGMF